MPFWVYENAPTNHVTIHESSCGFCNDGKGTRRAKLPGLHARWLGPYADLDAARSIASRLGRPTGEHSCCSQEPRKSAGYGFKKFELPSVDEASLTTDELFHRRMLGIYVSMRDEIGYTAIRFLSSVRGHGGVEHAKRSLRRPVKMQAGFERLKDEGLLDKSMEAYVSDPAFRTLFTEEEIAEARRRLEFAKCS